MVSQDLVSDPPVPPCPPPFLAIFGGFWTPRGVPPRDPPRTSFGPKKLNFWGSRAGARRSKAVKIERKSIKMDFFLVLRQKWSFLGIFWVQRAPRALSPPIHPFKTDPADPQTGKTRSDPGPHVFRDTFWLFDQKYRFLGFFDLFDQNYRFWVRTPFQTPCLSSR